MAGTKSFEERLRIVEQTAESALLAAAGRMGRAEVSKAEFQKYRIEFAMLLNERLNVNQVPVSLGDLLHRIDALEASSGGSVPAVVDLSGILSRLDVLEAMGMALAADPPVVVTPDPPVADPPAAPVGFTGRFIDPLESHSGRNFHIRVEFSEALATGYASVRDHGFDVLGGRVVGARRVNRRSDLWELTVDPLYHRDVTVTSTSILQDASGRSLSSPITVSVPYDAT